MTEQTRFFLKEIESCVAAVRDLLHQSDFSLPRYVAVWDGLKDFNRVVTDIDVESFARIGARLEKVFSRLVDERRAPTALERELVELAVDWLDELATLYRENIPAPRTLVTELIYTFDLVERSQGAASLAELIAESEEPDLFADDPEIATENYGGSKLSDPFGDDPGFGLEFDLLQRTLTRMPDSRTPADDPFGDDPAFESGGGIDVADPKPPPYDVFADDPPLPDPVK